MTNYERAVAQKLESLRQNENVRILAIETSCDETAAAVVENGRMVLSNAVHTQIPLHMPFGGVVPEIASRSHVQKIGAVVRLALEQANLSLGELDAIAVTNGPGLVGALLAIAALRIFQPGFENSLPSSDQLVLFSEFTFSGVDMLWTYLLLGGVGAGIGTAAAAIAVTWFLDA